MADFTYETRTKLREQWFLQVEKQTRGKRLSNPERKLLPTESRGLANNQKEISWLEGLLAGNAEMTLSEVFKKKLSGLVDVCVRLELQEEFYYALDQMNQFQYTGGWYRRSLRDRGYASFVIPGIYLLWAYSKLDFYGGSLGDILTGRVSEEIYDHARTEFRPYWEYSSMLAAQIDRGNEQTIGAVRDIFLGESNTAMMSRELILGLLKSKSRDMYRLLGDFLLAARLQEGARQAVCETMDGGRPEAFLHLFQVIEDHGLIRYSSVKRAVSTWIGIFNENSVDRISEKLVRLMGQCVRSREFCREQLDTNDSVAISCGLWGIGFYDAKAAVEQVGRLVREGTKNQKMTASYFARSLQRNDLKMKVSKPVIFENPEDLELAACFLPCFMDGAYRKFGDQYENQNYSSMRDGKAMRPEVPKITEYFSDREEAVMAYGALKQIYEAMPKKGVTINPCIFPWYQVSMTRSDLALRLCWLAWALQDKERLDEAARLIPEIGKGGNYMATGRVAAARTILYKPDTPVRKQVLFELLHNPEEWTMGAAFKLVDAMDLKPEDYELIEKNLKYKKGRLLTMELIKRQKPEGIRASIGRLLLEKSEECHMGALDLAMQVKKDSKTEFAAVKPLLERLEQPTGKEQVLLDELLGGSSAAQDILNRPGYGLYDPEKKWVLPAVKTGICDASKLFENGEEACIQALERLNALIEENQFLEYRNWMGDEKTLGIRLDLTVNHFRSEDCEPLDRYPFRELWEEFYRTEIKTPEFLTELYFYQVCRRGRRRYESNLPLYKKVLGKGLMKKPPFTNLIEGLRFGAQANTVIEMLFQQFVPAEMKVAWGLSITSGLVEALDEKNAAFNDKEKRWNGTVEVVKRRSAEIPIFDEARMWLGAGTEEDWESGFALRFRLQDTYNAMGKGKDAPGSRQGGLSYSPYLGLRDYVVCYIRGIWDKNLLYKAIFTLLNVGTVLGPVSAVEQKGAVTFRDARPVEIERFFGYGRIARKDGKYRFDNIGDEMPEMALAHEMYRELVPLILSVELARGEQETPFSYHISNIHVVYGVDTLIRILTALGQDTLYRSTYAYGAERASRKVVLSHLLKVCRPVPGETASDLKKALKGTDISKKRLVEAAMYAEQWIPMVEEHLELPGFQSGCYYFMAHTNEQMDEFTTSMVAKYTPLSPEELADGAFDVNWFFEAYGKLGEKTFKLLYDAAKYSSSGIAHGRARKYADAALGKVTFEGLEAEIGAKRNKDLLMSVGLLPLPKETKEREQELLKRYQFIQKFKKESRNFGAQRRASEGRAVELALRNLSVNAGFTDVTRLTLRMETKLTENLGEYLEWKALSEEKDSPEIRLSVDETGKASMQVQKGQKPLKSVPAQYKKDERVLAYQALGRQLKEQYARTKQMMEQAMEDRTVFDVWEIAALMENPVVKPILSSLVYEKAGEASGNGESQADGRVFGFLTESGLMDWSGALSDVKPDDCLRIAHPFDLYQTGQWHEYQKFLFEKQIRQPFKQVFRELYVKLEEEKQKTESLLFAGNQIQPQKTVGALRSRRWVADYEDGLQKIYYKENIIARIYAMADWFSPSDIEAPTLESVVFLDRKSFRAMKIEEIPDVIYSEVMRDVDLAVSVAHAGGVDPETSHSTVEMRRAIAECSLELFGIRNVRFEGSHAIIDGTLGSYTVHLGSGVVHQMGNAMLYVVPVHSQHRGRLFLPFVDDDPKTAEILSKILLFAEDTKIKDPSILSQIR